MIILILLIILLTSTTVPSPAQVIYANNQIPSQGVQIEYRLKIKNPNQHIYTVEIDIEGIRNETVSLAMPAWAPGAYRIRDYARNVQNFQTKDRSNERTLEWVKIDKQTWLITKEPTVDISVSYQLYSDGLNYEMADISGPSTYMYVVGYKHVPITLRYDKPRNWQVYTGLDRRRGTYRASDYDIFIDAPAFVGKFKVLNFNSGDIPYHLVFSNPKVEFNEEQVIGDIKAIVESATKMFGSVPFGNYTFLFKVQPVSGSGGLEHLNSTRITVGENDFANGALYDRFLFVVSHEFFHLWNVKRIRPEVLGPFDYTREVHTRSLWISEGLTSYYGRLLLNRSGISNPGKYLRSLSEEFNRHQQKPGRFLMSAEEASWETWLRSDNSENNTISYYTKGEIAGLLLDIEIRARTSSRKSLDDVMRYLMEHYAKRGVGFPEDGFLRALNTVAGSDFDEFYSRVIQGRLEIDYNRYLAQAGLRVEVQRQPSSLFMGVSMQEGDGGLATISRVIPGSPAQEAGFDRGDVLIAFNERRITFANFQTQFRRRKLGETFDVTFLRGEKVLHLELRPGETQRETWAITEANSVNLEQLDLRNRWIGELN